MFCSILPWTHKEGFLVSQVKREKKKKTLELTKELLKNIHLLEDGQSLVFEFLYLPLENAKMTYLTLVDQTVKNPPAMWGTWVRSLGWEDPLEEGMANHSSFLG